MRKKVIVVALVLFLISTMYPGTSHAYEQGGTQINHSLNVFYDLAWYTVNFNHNNWYRYNMNYTTGRVDVIRSGNSGLAYINSNFSYIVIPRNLKWYYNDTSTTLTGFVDDEPSIIPPGTWIWGGYNSTPITMNAYMDDNIRVVTSYMWIANEYVPIDVPNPIPSLKEYSYTEYFGRYLQEEVSVNYHFLDELESYEEDIITRVRSINSSDEKNTPILRSLAFSMELENIIGKKELQPIINSYIHNEQIFDSARIAGFEVSDKDSIAYTEQYREVFNNALDEETDKMFQIMLKALDMDEDEYWEWAALAVYKKFLTRSKSSENFSINSKHVSNTVNQILEELVRYYPITFEKATVVNSTIIVEK